MNQDIIPTCKSHFQRHLCHYFGLLLILLALLTISVFVCLNMMPSSELDIEPKVIASGILKLDKWYQNPPTKIPVEPEIVSDLINSLKPYHIDQNPAKWISLGVLEFELKNGAKYTIILFDPEQEQAAFRIDSTYYRGGSNRKLKSIVDNIRKRGNGQKWVE